MATNTNPLLRTKRQSENRSEAEDENSTKKRCLPQANPGPVKRYTQKESGRQRYCTEFKWIMPDWTLLYDVTYSKGIKSDIFKLEGIDECTCRLFFIPKDSKGSLCLELSDSISILAMKILIQINKQDPLSFSFYRPNKKRYGMELPVLPKLRKIHQVLDSEESKESNDSLTILAKIIVTRSPQISLLKNPPANILGKIKTLYDNKTLCDVTFTLGDKKLLAHKAVLAAQSQVFQAMFLSMMTETEKGVVDIVDTNVEIFQSFLHYLYTGEADDLQDIVEDMIVVADKYEVSELKIMCENHMLENLCSENVVRYIIIADKLCCVRLKGKALDFIQSSSKVCARVIQDGDLEVSTCLRKILNDSTET